MVCLLAGTCGETVDQKLLKETLDKPNTTWYTIQAAFGQRLPPQKASKKVLDKAVRNMV